LASRSVKSGAAAGVRPDDDRAPGADGLPSAVNASTSLAGERPIANWAPTKAPAEVPRVKSARARSTPPAASPASSPASQAIPSGPPPPNPSARVAIDVLLFEVRSNYKNWPPNQFGATPRIA